jgi:hypothetical protein
MATKVKKLMDVRVGDVWSESDPRFVTPWNRIVVSLDDERVTLAYVNGPLVGRKPATVKRARFNGGVTGYGRVERPTVEKMTAVLEGDNWSRSGSTWTRGAVAVDGTPAAYVHHRLELAKGGKS